MGLKRLTILTIGVAWVVMAQTEEAQADQGFTYAQIMCLPASGYMTLSTNFIWDVAPPEIHRSSVYALVDPDALKRHPFVCKIKGKSVEISANPAVESQEMENCASQLGGTNLSISIDGRAVDVLKQVDCKGRRYNFAATIDSDFPTRSYPRRIFIDHCIVDLQPVGYRSSEPNVLASASGNMECFTKALSEKSGAP